MQWLRRSLVTGFVVTVPLIITVAAFVWLFQLIDGLMGPVYARWLTREVPGLGLATLLVLVLLVGVLATNVFGSRLLGRGEAYLLRLPVFRAVYGPVKQAGRRVFARQPVRLQTGRPDRRSAPGSDDWVSNQGVCPRARTWCGGAGCRVCTDEPYLLR